jgi:signal transduction histidine kinase
LFVTYSIKAVTNADTRKSAILAFFDSTELREAQQALTETISLLHATLESTADGILVVDANGHIATFNQRFAEMWGIPQSILESGDDTAAIGHALTQLCDPREFLDEVERLYASTAESKDLLHFKAGRVRDREAREQHALELETLVSELETARDSAEESARMKSIILNNMSHEIRTPMTAIIGFAQILAEELDSDHIEFVNYITDNGQRLLDTINAILDFSKFEARQDVAQLETISLVEALSGHLALLKPIADSKDLYLKLIADDEFELIFDETYFARTIYNLVGNAIKFTESGGVTVSVERGTGGVHISIQDTGIGIAEEFIPKLFSEFTQESDGLTRSHNGSGLGLAITERMVTAMGGIIIVSSLKGFGSCFTVVLPENKCRGAEDRQPRHSSVPGAASINGRFASE